jgi:hypothetical protein
MNRTPPKPRPFVHPVKRSFRVLWSSEDGGNFVGFCDQYPGVSHFAGTGAGAMRGIMELVAQIDRGEAVN